MSKAVTTQSSFSSRSSTSMTRVSKVRSVDRSRISTASTLFSGTGSPSVYGGAGGFGTRVSQASVFSGVMLGGDAAWLSNEKTTMQNLNDRLASYLEKVSALETANKTLELQIREFHQQRAPESRDLSGFLTSISHIKAQVLVKLLENQRLVLEMENSRLAAEDFKMKYETELSMRMIVEADMTRLRGATDSLARDRTDLQTHLDHLEEDLMIMKRNQKEALEGVRTQQEVRVNVEMDCAESADLPARLAELREHYEVLMAKNNQEMETWFQNKMVVTSETCTKDLTTFSTVLSDTQRTSQSLELELQSLVSYKYHQEQNVEEIGQRYTLQLSQLQLHINKLETEIQRLNLSIQDQRSEYTMLLDIKMRLEMEIAEYRRLLGEETQTRVVISKVVEEVQEIQKPHIDKIIKTIVEEVIDGKVVSSSVDTQIVNIQ